MSPSQQNKEEQKLEKEQEEEEEDLIVCPICANVLQVYTCRINSKSSPVCYTYCTECNQFLLLSEVDALKLEKNNKKKKVRKSLQEKIEEINKKEDKDKDPDSPTSPIYIPKHKNIYGNVN